MKSRIVYFWCILLSLTLILCTILIYKIFFTHPESATIIQCPTEIISTKVHPGNNRQRRASVWLGCYDKKLYYFGGGKNNSLYVFQEGGLVEVFPLSHDKDNITILGIVDCFLYYRENNRGDYENQKLYCYNLEINEETLLFSGTLSLAASLYFANDGSVYFPLLPRYGKASEFVHVSGQSILGVEPLTDGYSLGENTYYVVSEYSDVQVERVLKSDDNNNSQLDELFFDQAYNRSIIPYDDGLLVHNEGLNSILYRINLDGSITSLFSVPCLASESAVNVRGTDAYLSVLRYEEYGEKGMLRYENDSLEGTYRISLIDGSMQKINDMCFDGLYNFDDTCFYCSDKHGNLYKMEFDGAISPVLLISQVE